MHLLFRETHDLDGQAMAEDLGHEPADLVLLSFSESDLLGLSAVHGAQDPSLRVATLSRLRHPMSVDLYLEQTISRTRCVVVRLLGGTEYWRYGVDELRALCRARSIPLAFITGEATPNPALKALSNVDTAQWERLDGLFREGGARNLRCALTLMASLAGLAPDDGAIAEALPPAGVYRRLGTERTSRVLLVFYRAHLLAADLDGVDALAEALYESGLGVDLIYVASLRAPSVLPFVDRWMMEEPPEIILNATFFAARGDDGTPSLLEAAQVPVVQILQPSATLGAWQKSGRGLSQSDLAMQCVLPELDGRLTGTPISFRDEAAPGLPARRVAHAPGIALMVQQVQGWLRLARQSPAERRLALVLSDYPGAEGQAAHAVGLDGFASVEAIATLLRDAGYAITSVEASALPEALCQAPMQRILEAGAYRLLFEALPEGFREKVIAAWGAPDQPIEARFVELGTLVVALQPGRGRASERKAQYHDPDVPPCHAYIGFYLWLRATRAISAMIHLGTHGTLEWLPGKSVALSESCAPPVLLGGVPVIYPFIVNNPGEASAAKRRLGAVMIGHMTPPVQRAGLDSAMVDLERLIDEYAEADGLDRRRGALLRRQILDRAADLGVLAESGVAGGETDEAEALARLDAYLCDVKDLQIRDGLHVFGCQPPRHGALVEMLAESAQVASDIVTSRLDACPQAERQALLAALDGRFVPPGPAGAPTRGRLDVLPTGRNLTTIDPRLLPSRAALILAHKTADLLLTRHLQEEGENLRHLVLDLWGSATLRTGGEDMALAFLLMGVQPLWDATSGRISGFEIVPLTTLDRPRVDVTLRISGLFRDAFPGLIALFDQAARAVAARAEDEAWNPLTRDPDASRIFGAAPGAYGTGVEAALAEGSWQTRDELGQLYLDGSQWSYGGDREAVVDAEGLRARLGRAEMVLHIQDHAETDLLDGVDTAAHEGGLAAAAAMLGNTPKLLHGDTSQPETPKLRDVSQEVARITRGRLANPRWIAGMMRHGYRGAAEMARGVMALEGYASTLSVRFDRQIDLAFAALLENDDLLAFFETHNPQALSDMKRRFASLRDRGLWQPRRNVVAQILES
ncbi:cobaltochelatase subunit CobN [Asaia spathodeae]|uniref:Cobaltochelatase subunit CobN n=1 Tax=Asaia spathodeae TaxID=657016 RepID=A0ABX2P4M1_9PROT|nr:cobaltochelatase subunit CobN [Asaia spathodeae]GBR21272.1 cobaltochelatase subunit CobN [Asaia spathodeae NBRC 105894]